MGALVPFNKLPKENLVYLTTQSEKLSSEEQEFIDRCVKLVIK